MYQYSKMSINSLIYHCVLINELFSAMDKTLKLTFYNCEKNLVQNGDNYGFTTEEIILSLSAS